MTVVAADEALRHKVNLHLIEDDDFTMSPNALKASLGEEIQPRSTGEHVLRLKEECTVSHTYRKNVRSIAPLWVGT